MTYQTLTLENLYHYIFSTTGQTRANSDQLTHDLVLWLNHHSFEELPDALVTEFQSKRVSNSNPNG